MTWLRRHLLAFVAVCVALAAGLALGAGPLQDVDKTGTTAAQTDVNSEDAPDDDPFRESVTRAASQLLVEARLQGGFITLLVLPDVDNSILDGMTTVIEQAGGELAATVRIDEAFIDPGKKSYVDSVAGSSADGVDEMSDIPSDDTYGLIAALLARAYVTDEGQGSAPLLDEVATKIDSELQGAKLVTVRGDPLRRASLVVVLTPGEHGDDDLTAASHLIETKLVTAVATQASATLVATAPAASKSGGLLDVLAEADELSGLDVSTLNVINSAAGQVSSIYALSATATGQSGDFGIVGDKVVLPPGLSAPE